MEIRTHYKALKTQILRLIEKDTKTFRHIALGVIKSREEVVIATRRK